MMNNSRPGAMAQHLHVTNLQLKIIESGGGVVVLEHPVLKERWTWTEDEFSKLWKVIGEDVERIQNG